MTSEQFCWWLTGFLGAGDDHSLTWDHIHLIREKLDDVLTPWNEKGKVQRKLNTDEHTEIERKMKEMAAKAEFEKFKAMCQDKADKWKSNT
jgi:hypothetical protein